MILAIEDISIKYDVISKSSALLIRLTKNGSVEEVFLEP